MLSLLLVGCVQVAQTRIVNKSKLDFTDISISGTPYPDIPAGASSDYRPVKLRFRYAHLKFAVGQRYLTGQTLNFVGDRFTYVIDVEDPDTGQPIIDVSPED